MEIRDSFPFRLTLFYGDPATTKRKFSWDLLRRLRDNSTSVIPWTVIGDFNEILCSSESEGARARPSWQMDNFRLALDDCNLTDLGYVGYPFTFSNHRVGKVEVKARLDRAVANS
ncbi:hypothetical protein QQ045_033352 [Rhodiola kirilowii]